ncbi:MAG TPA: type II toxin-antitoxin system VapB family antitoxin [Gaiella sp.]|nr:type II toxin-antitoxin system VapB family antitoxin [Gaiella sp.]
MALNIKNRATEQLAAEVAALTGETKTRAVQVALEERKARLSARTRRKSLHQFLEEEIWPLVPETERGQPSLTKAEREEILGIGPDGV